MEIDIGHISVDCLNEIHPEQDRLQRTKALAWISGRSGNGIIEARC